MSFTFKIEKPKVENEKLFQRTRAIIEERRGSISGYDKEGRISYKKFMACFEVSYFVGTEFIEITITKKPLGFPDSLIEEKIREYFSLDFS